MAVRDVQFGRLPWSQTDAWGTTRPEGQRTSGREETENFAVDEFGVG